MLVPHQTVPLHQALAAGVRWMYLFKASVKSVNV
jgi:hypothetical protein